MAHYAFLDDNNIVTEVIPGIDETELIEGKTPEIWYGEFRGQSCVRTSYNGKIRGVYAGVGYSYNQDEDIFILPQPYPSWTRDGSQWLPPVTKPDDELHYEWNEENGSWNVIS
jgi:hypothetical protein